MYFSTRITSEWRLLHRHLLARVLLLLRLVRKRWSRVRLRRVLGLTIALGILPWLWPCRLGRRRRYGGRRSSRGSSALRRSRLARRGGRFWMLQALVLPWREQLKADGAVVARVLIVISESVHVLVSPLTIADATGEWAQSAFSLALHLA